MKPTIRVVHQIRGAARAQGLTVVIDVLRAFTTTCHIAAGGARQILVYDTTDHLLLKQRHPGAILVGERDGRRLPGFDAGNSPSQARLLEWTGRTVLISTSNGTRGLIAARNAQHVLCGSFVNAHAIVSYIRDRAPAVVSLVCMGSRGRPTVEDTLCAHYLRACLLDEPADFTTIRRKIMAGPCAAGFLCSKSPDMPPQDLDLCLSLNCFDFVLVASAGPNASVSLERCDRKTDRFKTQAPILHEGIAPICNGRCRLTPKGGG
jgi:2-phosphosulfolactate phosphatase